MRIKIIKFLALLMWTNAIWSQEKHPDAEAAMLHFYSTYDLTYSNYPRVQFDKVKHDWYVRTLEVENQELIKGERMLFYSSSTGYMELSLPRHAATQKIMIEDYLNDYDRFNYDLHPYYGYNGWYNDVIKELKGRGSLSENEQYSLGRAFSSKAVAPITDNNADVLPEEIMEFPLGPNSLSKEQELVFTSNADQAIENFRQLAKRNPNYITGVGTIYHKYSNEHLFKYHILLSFAENAAKRIFLPTGLYNDSTLQAAKNLLEKSPPGAIFLAMGDNDFYPLLYQQKKNNIRKDVYVLSYNLIGIDRYAYRARFSQHEAPGIKMESDTSLYNGNTNGYFYVKDSNASVSLPILLKILAGEGERFGMKQVSTNAVVISHKNKAGNKDVSVSIADANYLLKNHWILLDILHNLDGRPLVMMSPFYDELAGLNIYLKQRDKLYFFEP